MNEKNCRVCGEKNPEEAVMCWACYSSISTGTMPPPPQALLSAEPSWLSRWWQALHQPWRPSRVAIALPPPQNLPEAWRDVKICTKCRCRNPLGATVCWNCECALAELPRDTSKICPRCRELNPADDNWCIVCYTEIRDVPADGKLIGEIRCPLCYESNPEIASKCRICSYDLQHPAAFYLSPWLLLNIALVGVSGWLPNLYAQMAFALGGIAILKWIRNGRNRYLSQFMLEKVVPLSPEDKILSDEDCLSDTSPIARITNAMLMYAIRDGATQITLGKTQHGVRVQYEINGEWHEQMKVPSYVWVPLREHLAARAKALQTAGRGKGRGVCQGQFECVYNQRKYAVALNYEWLGHQPYESITLDLN